MDEQELRDLQERVALVKEMAAHPGWRMLQDRALHTLLIKQTYIIQGKCKSYEEYLKEVAFTDGVEYLMKLPDRLDLELEMALDNLPPAEDEDEI